MDGVETETQVVGNLLRLTSFKVMFLFYTENLPCSPKDFSVVQKILKVA